MSDQPSLRHNLHFENLEGESRTSSDGHVLRALSGLTVVTCACGFKTEAMPSDDARLVYEQHRHLIKDETGAAGA
ncbi:hypothetical protein [Streptomyces sp. CB00455]|uniref:hypothetical protein n=1 Tax=Streptomyces sp. CB00455 TaxID=1703927 RepID=UPI001160FCEE|nr:hypothetical protein [Streptomyces sp. CB00455]